MTRTVVPMVLLGLLVFALTRKSTPAAPPRPPASGGSGGGASAGEW